MSDKKKQSKEKASAKEQRGFVAPKPPRGEPLSEGHVAPNPPPAPTKKPSQDAESGGSGTQKGNGK